jgi:hypothetical protein
MRTNSNVNGGIILWSWSILYKIFQTFQTFYINGGGAQIIIRWDLQTCQKLDFAFCEKVLRVLHRHIP